ncbi:P-loop containing nucleoside triphosphate hydrolases superfamily protein [Striga hermonthica]|uniref:P-loop containing nucleoside triphosphate hydrolases superfamily protein n=1 Tax=Striga hermonthica TaxID=68872 RepID=A0A9N7RPE0_STRHE|nr:P-loop containing nucleoside triphosphate hydrolases superfamily protein [Striga hermonthica]
MVSNRPKGSQITIRQVLGQFGYSGTPSGSRDLDRFVRRRDYYRRVGKAWKRGYLLYGPPGTGKSSLVAAMANYLKFDVYDLELTSVYSNSDLRRTLLSTNNRSIIVIEDVDCSAQMHDRDGESDGDSNSERGNSSGHELTLSGMLNFIDGLWSTCGDERIIIFTTNHKEKLDPALLRPGRMDMHIHMGYCTPEGFDVLVLNYLEINDHPLFSEIKELIREIEVTPAEIAEHLMRNEDPSLALEGVLNLLKQKKKVENVKNEKSEAKENEINGDYDECNGVVEKKRKSGQQEGVILGTTHGTISMCPCLSGWTYGCRSNLGSEMCRRRELNPLFGTRYGSAGPKENLLNKTKG